MRPSLLYGSWYLAKTYRGVVLVCAGSLSAKEQAQVEAGNLNPLRRQVNTGVESYEMRRGWSWTAQVGQFKWLPWDGVYETREDALDALRIHEQSHPEQMAEGG